MTQEEIDNALSKIWSYVDYTVGDWVETCNMLPGIVQSIDISYDKKHNYFHETVEIFYPQFAFNHKYYPYKGRSRCSITNCGVHKITPEYACKLMTIGEKKLTELWKAEENRNFHWNEVVEKYYNKL